jgi:dolichol-phosphate mannosyltransferase
MNSESGLEISVVVPVLDEAENIVPLADEIYAALAGGPEFEIVYVDDGSSDESFEVLSELASTRPNFRAVRHASRAGQSAAILSGVRAAEAPLIATLDGDGQNDPADIPKLLALYRAEVGTGAPLMVAGHRRQRRDGIVKRASSRIANGVRSRMLGDQTPDTGCGLKLFPRQVFLDFPAFDHMHRFLPALMLRAGGRVISEEVGHRARARGQSKYGMWDRLWVGIADLRGVAWLARRAIKPEVAEIKGTSGAPATPDAGA